MLPANARLRRSEDFRTVIKGGARAGRRRLVLHAQVADGLDPTAGTSRAGFVVSKAVGNSVVRHRVARRLRHLVSARLGTLPAGSSLVVRALPSAASASSLELGSDLDAALRRLGLLPARGTGSPRESGPRGGGSTVRRAPADRGEDGPTV